jgi:hypothetical protein
MRLFCSGSELKRANANSTCASFPRPEPSQKVSKLLLLSIFAISSRFSEDEAPLPPEGKLWEAGCNYLNSALSILSTWLSRSHINFRIDNCFCSQGFP